MSGPRHLFQAWALRVTRDATRDRGRTQTRTLARGEGPFGRLRLLVAALILLEASAIALKAWEETQSAERAALATLQREALAIGERLNGMAARMGNALDLAAEGAVELSRIPELTGQDMTVRRLSDAAAETAPLRSRDAAGFAATLDQDGARYGLTSEGDVVIRSLASTGQPTLAYAPADDWLPQPSGDRRFTLVGPVQASRGSVSLARPDPSRDLAQAQIVPGKGDQRRTASACTPLEGTPLTACTSIPLPLLTRESGVRILIYALLLAGPTLALIGLIGHIGGGRGRGRALRPLRHGPKGEGALVEPVALGAAVGAWIWHPETGEVEVGPIAAGLFGLPSSGLTDVDALLASADDATRPALADALAEAETTGWLRVRMATRDARAWLELRGSPPIGGAPEEFHGVVSDVTVQVDQERRVQSSENRLREALDAYDGPVAIWGPMKRLRTWNRAFTLTFGLSGEVRPGLSYETAALSRTRRIHKERASPGDSNATLLQMTDGRWLRLVERPTAEGGLVTIGMDVTAHVEAEDTLTDQSEKLQRVVAELERSEGHKAELARKYREERARAQHAAETKSAFLANMSHELRTPLNAINGFSEILASELYGPLGDPRYKGYAEDILTSGQHLLDMINDILDMAKIEAGKMTVSLHPIDPVDPVDAAVRMIRRKAEDKGVTLDFFVEEDLPRIDADERAMRQMVLNLVSNAIKFTDAGGRVSVAIVRRGSEIAVSVTDSGIGIPRDQIERLGQPFEQVTNDHGRAHEGTGLGLALTKSFAEMHGGRLTIASDYGKGTRVTFYLPVPTDSAGEPANDRTSTPAASPSPAPRPRTGTA